MKKIIIVEAKSIKKIEKFFEKKRKKITKKKSTKKTSKRKCRLGLMSNELGQSVCHSRFH